MNLFENNHKSAYKPLAEKMRPRSLDEFFGQLHLLGPGKLLRNLIENDLVPSMILQGPPATGKTSLAYVISQITKAEFVQLNAVTLNIAELRKVLDLANDNRQFYSKKTLVFIDEIHAMKSTLQMSLLQAVEQGTIVLIGATTESVTHDIIPPLASRCKIYNLHPLACSDIEQIISKALTDTERGLGSLQLTISEQALTYLADACNGDTRSALNALEIASYSIVNGNTINLEMIQQALQSRTSGVSTTDFYDLTSAFIKSLRGSQSDAAIYWLARLLIAGADPLFIARRMVIQASEDVGLANPQALQIAIAAKQAVEFIGMPEARICLAQAAIYIAESPKSNSAYKAINLAMNLTANTFPYPVPKHLQNSTGLYQNPLDHPAARLDYLPRELKDKTFYNPQDSGIEKNIFSKYNNK